MDAREKLADRQNPDGGFGPVLGASSEPEPTALAALALGDAGASRWLEARQAPDGSVGIRAGDVFRDVTALASLAMTSPDAVSNAIARVERVRARKEPSTEDVPHDPTLRGWSWTDDTFGWAEPTAWGVLALRRVGSLGEPLGDGLALLRDRECAGGGWNYGNRVVLDEDLPAFVQTTSIVLISLRGIDDPMVDPIVDRGLDWLAEGWRGESDGLLSVASAAAALGLFGHAEAASAGSAVRDRLASAGAPDTIALAWAAIALGEGIAALEVR